MKPDETLLLLKALSFAADKHSRQTRKGAVTIPYINHPIETARVLAEIGKESDCALLAAAMLHDTVEDTNTSPTEIEALFGAEIRAIVDEVTDDKSLPKPVRKQKQIETAPHKSNRAKALKVADKICNVNDMVKNPPMGWPISRRLKYLDWAAAVHAGLKGANPLLDSHLAGLIVSGREAILAEKNGVFYRLFSSCGRVISSPVRLIQRHLRARAKKRMFSSFFSNLFSEGDDEIGKGAARLRSILNNVVSEQDARAIYIRLTIYDRVSQDLSEASAVKGIRIALDNRISEEDARKAFRDYHGISGDLFTGGDGSSQESAVVINADNSLTNVKAQHYWIQERYGNRDEDWTQVSNFLSQVDGRSYDTFTLKHDDGTLVSVWFEVTQALAGQQF